MNNQTNPTDYPAFARSLDATITNTRRRNALSLGASLVSLALLGYWLTAAYAKFSVIDPDFAAGYVMSEFEERLPQTSRAVERRLTEAAPLLVAAAEKHVAALPDSLAAHIRSRTDAELEKALPELEEELYTSLKTTLADVIDKKTADKDGAAQLRKLVATLADTYETEATRMIDTIHDRYTSVGADTLTYLDYLAEGKDLDKTEQMHREMLTTFLTIAARQRLAETDADGTLGTPVAPGAPLTAPTPHTPADPSNAAADIK